MDLDSAHSLFKSARADHRRGNLADARRKYETLLKVHPTHVGVLRYLGQALREDGEHESAIKHLRAALSVKPDDPLARGQLGIALQEQGNPREAIQAVKRAVALAPQHSDVHCCLGFVLQLQDRLDEAAKAYRRAIQLRPDSKRAHTDLGCVLSAQGRDGEAVAAHRMALSIDPEYATGHNNLGQALKGLGEIDEAIAAYREAIRLKPSFAKAHANLAHNLLMTGNFEEGFREWEWRTIPKFPKHFWQPRWNGEALIGRTLLLYSEQGLGDTIQFVRFADPIRRSGGAVIIVVADKMVRLLRHSLREVKVISQKEIGSFDYYLPLLSAPHRLGTIIETIPSDFPYILAEPERVDRWAARIPPAKLRIGISWQGNPNGPDDANRSIPLRAFEPLSQIPDVLLISLQKGHGVEHLRALPSRMHVHDLGPDFDSGKDAFLDTAAVMMNLDLVITSDTAIAHLAGALARPTWVALQRSPDWRWQVGTEHSVWYPTMRLFRQETLRDWSQVFRTMADLIGKGGVGGGR